MVNTGLKDRNLTNEKAKPFLPNIMFLNEEQLTEASLGLSDWGVSCRSANVPTQQCFIVGMNPSARMGKIFCKVKKSHEKQLFQKSSSIGHGRSHRIMKVCSIE